MPPPSAADGSRRRCIMPCHHSLPEHSVHTLSHPRRCVGYRLPGAAQRAVELWRVPQCRHPQPAGRPAYARVAAAERRLPAHADPSGTGGCSGAGHSTARGQPDCGPPGFAPRHRHRGAWIGVLAWPAYSAYFPACMRCCNETQALPPMQPIAGPLTSDICHGCHLCRCTRWMCRHRGRARAGRCTRCGPPFGHESHTAQRRWRPL